MGARDYPKTRGGHDCRPSDAVAPGTAVRADNGTIWHAKDLTGLTPARIEALADLHEVGVRIDRLCRELDDVVKGQGG